MGLDLVQVPPDPEYTPAPAMAPAPPVRVQYAAAPAAPPAPVPTPAPVRRPVVAPAPAPEPGGPVFVPVRRPAPAPARRRRWSSTTVGTATGLTVVFLAGSGFLCGLHGPGLEMALESLGLALGSTATVLAVHRHTRQR